MAGPMGVDGEKGHTGERGDKGEQGIAGDGGDIGPMGESGAKGEKGDPGVSGKTGSDGDNGLAGDNGADGPRGIAGLNGLRGERGTTGPAGLKGDRGADGKQGKKGSDGESVTKLSVGPDNTLFYWIDGSKRKAGTINVTFPDITISGGGGGGSSGSGGGVASVNAGRDIEITGTASNPIVNLGLPESITLSHFVFNEITQRLTADVPIETTLNSFFIGGQHSLTSGGENVFFTEHSKNINYIPCWVGIKDQFDPANQDATGILPAYARVYSDDAVFVEINGPESFPVQYVDSDHPFTLASSVSKFGTSFRPELTMPAGTNLQLNIYSGSDDSGLRIYQQNIAVPFEHLGGDLFDWQFDHPVEGLAGDEFFYVIMVTYPSQAPQVISISQNMAGTLPYSNTLLRSYDDKLLAIKDDLVGDSMPPWHIISGQTVTAPTRREYALHGEFLLEGELILQGSSRLRLNA